MSNHDLQNFARMAADISASMLQQANALRLLAIQVEAMTRETQRRIDDHETRIAKLESRRAK